MQHPREKYIKPEGTEVRSSGQLGRGVFALRNFKKGDTVVKGIVERVVESRGEHTFTIHGVHVVLEGPGCLVNHSCDPNCMHVFNESGTFDLIAQRESIKEYTIPFLQQLSKL